MDIAGAALLQESLAALWTLNLVSDDEWDKWAEHASPELRQRAQRLTTQLSAAVHKHVFVPTAIASRHGSATHKLHNLLHSLNLDTGSWESTDELCHSISTVTSDRGTESLLESTPHTLAELGALGFLPSVNVREPQAAEAAPSQGTKYLR